MPTYEYVCDACDHKFDEFQAMSDKPLKKCPQCKKSKLRRLFGTGAALIFKGSGFYQTDYRSESYQKGAKADQPAVDTSSSGKAKESTESKPASSGESGTSGKKAKSKE